MAFRTQKISQMTPKGSDLEATDLIEVSTIESGSYVTRSITGQELIDAIPLPPSGITIGTTAITSGTVGRVLFEGAGNVVQESANLFWDNTNARLGIGTSSPFGKFDVKDGEVFVTTSTNANLRSRLTYQGIYVSRAADGTYTEGIYSTTSAWLYSSRNSHSFFRDGVNLFNVGGGFASGAMNIFTNGNVAINTTTDTGFKLDVNGTARVLNSKFSNNGMQIQTTSSNPGGISLNGSAEVSNQLTVSSGFTIRQSNSVNGTSGAAINLSSATVISTSGEIAISAVSAQFGFTSGTATGNALSLTPFINTSGTYSGIIRGFYYAPTFGTTVGITAHYAFHSKVGRIRFEGLPTSPVGLASGEVWNNLGILTIV